MSKSKFDFLRPLTDEEYAGLKASIDAGGQISPIVRDQNRVTIDGHHRERALTELGVPESEWKIEIRSFATDKERFTFVNDVNVHRRQSTAEDRKRYAKDLAALGLTQQEIAEVLRVSQPTIARDLDGLFTVNKPPRPKGGRPKGSGKTPKLSVEARVSPIGRIAEPTIEKIKTDPTIDPATLSLTAQQKVEAHKRRLDRENEAYRRKLEREQEERKRKQDLEFEERVRAERLRRDQIWLANELEEFRKAVERNHNYRGFISESQYNVLLKCFHANVLIGIANQGIVAKEIEDRFNEALRIIMSLKTVLVKEESTAPPPPTMEEMMRRRAEYDAKNRARAQRAAATRAANAAKAKANAAKRESDGLQS